MKIEVGKMRPGVATQDHGHIQILPVKSVDITVSDLSKVSVMRFSRSKEGRLVCLDVTSSHEKRERIGISKKIIPRIYKIAAHILDGSIEIDSGPEIGL